MEEQINNLRAQLLRSEQEKELMRVKLQEEKLEREKAQKQVGTGAAERIGAMHTVGPVVAAKQACYAAWLHALLGACRHHC